MGGTPGYGDRRGSIADAVIRITSSRGLDRVSVREVANSAGIAIGTVQHYFSTKDAMLSFAFARVLQRTLQRVRAVTPEQDVRRRLSRLLRELLPLDEARRSEAAVALAFSSRAATSPALAEVQAETQRQIRGALSDIFRLTASQDPETDAILVLAVVDGLTLRAIRAPGQTRSDELVRALDAYLDQRFTA
jgi:AcrR family transcriptional regulator